MSVNIVLTFGTIPFKFFYLNLSLDFIVQLQLQSFRLVYSELSDVLFLWYHCYTCSNCYNNDVVLSVLPPEGQTNNRDKAVT